MTEPGSDTVCILDTSIFCEILGVAGKSDRHRETLAELERRVVRRETLILPLATILETGNHIAQQRDGGKRRQVAKSFVRQVRHAIEDDAPLQLTSKISQEDVLAYLDRFPDEAMRQVGLGDLTIRHEFERQCDRHPGRRVYIWSKDQHLQACDRAPAL